MLLRMNLGGAGDCDRAFSIPLCDSSVDHLVQDTRVLLSLGGNLLELLVSLEEHLALI